MIFTHQVVVLCLRYIIEEMDEAQILAIDRAGDVANCAITDYRYDPRAGKSGGLVLQRYNVTAPMEAAATEVTQAPDALAGARGRTRDRSIGTVRLPLPFRPKTMATTDRKCTRLNSSTSCTPSMHSIARKQKNTREHI